MTTIQHAALIDAEPGAVWHLLRQFGVIDTWHPQISECVIEGGKVSGDGGSIRTLNMVSGEVIHERLLAIDNERMTLTYGLSDAALPLEDFSATVGVRAVDDGRRSEFQWQASFEGIDEAAATKYRSLLDQYILEGIDGLAQHLGSAARASHTSTQRHPA